MRYFLIAVAAAGVSFSTLASVEQAVLDCAKVENAQQRLACYDDLSVSLQQHVEKSQADVAQSDVEPVVSSTSSKEPTAAAIDRFGAKPVEVIKSPEEINLTIASIRESVRGELIITFENGQVWKQVEQRRYRLEAGDKVTIKKAALGSFLLQAEGRNRSIRVQRQQ
ncbi:hypothetical protein JYB87_16890 [Shewanella avicenniae]|uniref:Uncharacterized protein n=1 Tax=Shewanella avicenniae TaxID=2814294 RepID=A0ABX7QR14_9GAMM|nr:hypothetical protein [Shewanella avicenniae]QSX33371.1 hypothetical protein JYB87_16890 [Shewanella avicenniae]